MTVVSEPQDVPNPPIGGVVGVSDWVVVDQAMIDAFGAVTLDRDPMHVSPDWAAEHSPFDETIAFGFLTISLLTALLRSALGEHPAGPAEGSGYYLNYGFDRLRLLTPVRVGSRVRGRFSQLRQVQDEAGRWKTTFGCTIEIEGGDRPALVAEWLCLWTPQAATA